MPRLRTLVVAVWVMLTIAGSPAAAPALGAPDASGTVDATTDLQALIDRTPDGAVVRLQAGGNYRVEGTLLLVDRHDLRIEGNGARIFARTVREGSRSHLRIVGGSDLVVRDLEIHGANPHAGLDDRAYVEELVGQHGIRIEGATDVELDGVRVLDVFGDFVYMGRHDDRRWTERVWIHDSIFTRSGRQGLSVTAGRDVVIERNIITDTHRASIDLEPNTPTWGADNVHILDNAVGPGNLLFVAAGGAGPVNNVVIARNSLHGHNLSFWVIPPAADRRQRFWVVDNTSDTPVGRVPLQFTRVDGAVVTGNRQPITRPDGALVQAVDSCGVSVAGNQTEPGTIGVSGGGPACGFNMSSTPPEPPAVAGRGRPQPAPTAPTTEAPTTTPTTIPTTEAPTTTPTTEAPTTEAPPPSPTPLAASETSDDGAGAGWIALAVAVVLLLAAGGGAALAISARRERR